MMTHSLDTKIGTGIVLL